MEWDFRRDRESEADISFAAPDEREVDRENDGAVAGLFRLGKMIERLGAVELDVELEPARSVGGGPQLRVAIRRERGHRRQRAGSRCRAHGGALGLGIEQPLERERRDAERHRNGRSEERRVETDLADVHERPGP